MQACLVRNDDDRGGCRLSRLFELNAGTADHPSVELSEPRRQRSRILDFATLGEDQRHCARTARMRPDAALPPPRQTIFLRCRRSMSHAGNLPDVVGRSRMRSTCGTIGEHRPKPRRQGGSHPAGCALVSIRSSFDLGPTTLCVRLGTDRVSLPKRVGSLARPHPRIRLQSLLLCETLVL